MPLLFHRLGILLPCLLTLSVGFAARTDGDGLEATSTLAPDKAYKPILSGAELQRPMPASLKTLRELGLATASNKFVSVWAKSPVGELTLVKTSPDPEAMRPYNIAFGVQPAISRAEYQASVAFVMQTPEEPPKYKDMAWSRRFHESFSWLLRFGMFLVCGVLADVCFHYGEGSFASIATYAGIAFSVTGVQALVDTQQGSALISVISAFVLIGIDLKKNGNTGR